VELDQAQLDVVEARAHRARGCIEMSIACPAFSALRGVALNLKLEPAAADGDIERRFDLPQVSSSGPHRLASRRLSSGARRSSTMSVFKRFRSR